MNSLAYLFPVFFIGMFVFVLFLLSKKGWSDLADKYKFEGVFQGERVGITSLGINGVNYNNCLLLKYSNDGFYLRPVFIFRLFHPPICIPWKDVADIRDKKILFMPLKELVIGTPAIALMQIRMATFSRIERMFNTKTISH